MKRLHERSILDCTEQEELIHQAEMKQIREILYRLPDYDCDISITYEDDYHKHRWTPSFFETNLHRFEEFVQNEDTKNGMDFFLTDEKALVIRAYGHGYTYQGQSELLTTLIRLKPYGEGMIPIDLSRVFDTHIQSIEHEWTD